MFKHIAVLLSIILLTFGTYLSKFGVPDDASSWANFGSFSGGTAAVLIALYGVIYTIWQHRNGKSKYTIEDHIRLMGSYKSAHSGGYTNKGYEFLKWLWPNAVSQLTRDGKPTVDDILNNSNLSEMAQWKRSILKVERKLIAQFVNEMSREELKLAWLYCSIGELPKEYKNAIEPKWSELPLSDSERSLFDAVKSA
ncbi:hypothetical protein ACSTEA_23250 [Vibrio vulnificus]|uniref:hypothetical protein n=1 Tax=Vibrio vulnificus TaxID=672 RepID=UPI00102A4B02|nr:hypothetical protein [Vibrio vulnificus]ELB2132578.1 hypothetical protein [Vibrio parahaemolyticus]ELB2147471.1 hypothetical protein [Vibrio parahaemolyticus]ELB2240176.1 hypothetical protein [Vibrio parahaemolyticus]RZR34238.1 hypothetical protein D8T59_21030 [Vibrio vulnificus]